MFFLCSWFISGVKLELEEMIMIIFGCFVIIRLMVFMVSVMLVEFLLMDRLIIGCSDRCFMKLVLCWVCLVV